MTLMDCSECGHEVSTKTGACPNCGAPVGQAEIETKAHYYPVSVLKFVVLSVLTFGYYQIFWFYKNWRFIKDRDGAPIYPWARALFAPLWFYALIDDVNRSQLTDPIGKGAAFGLSAAYFVVVGTSRSADPFWLTLFLSFFPILPLVRRINNFGGLQSFHLSHNSAWKARHFVLVLFLGPWLVFTVASTVMLIPSTQVVDGWLVWGQSRNFLEESGVVEPGESILYFYGDGLFSFEEDGNLLTESRVISYWTDPASGEFLSRMRISTRSQEPRLRKGVSRNRLP